MASTTKRATLGHQEGKAITSNIIWVTAGGTAPFRSVLTTHLPIGEPKWRKGPYTIKMRLEEMVFEGSDKKAVKAYVFCGVREGNFG
jgi:hypothetical protein